MNELKQTEEVSPCHDVAMYMYTVCDKETVAYTVIYIVTYLRIHIMFTRLEAVSVLNIWASDINRQSTDAYNFLLLTKWCV